MAPSKLHSSRYANSRAQKPSKTYGGMLVDNKILGTVNYATMSATG